METRIAVGITTKNRRSIAETAISRWIEYSPDNCKIFIVDDGSDIPYPNADFRFEKSVGVSAAKNKALDLCSYADHIFIADDDCRPLIPDWHKRYTDSGLNHACYTFGREMIYSNGYYDQYEKPCGCMLYFKRVCLDTVGGWDTSFTGYSYEHVSLSDRIFNAGLTPGRYVDVKRTEPIFELANCESSFTSRDREQIPSNFKLYQDNFYSKEFKEFRG